jgi:hypothetical protein
MRMSGPHSEERRSRVSNYRMTTRVWSEVMSERTAAAIDAALALEWNDPVWDTVLEAAWLEHDRSVVLMTGGFDD